MKTGPLFRLLFLSVGLWAQTMNGATPSTLVTDSQGILGFDFYGRSLYWWDRPGRCSGEFPNDATIRLRGTATGSTRNVARDCTYMQSEQCRPVRDEAYFYFFVGRQLYRKAVNALEADPAQAVDTAPLSPTLASIQTGATLEYGNGYLYFARYSAASGSASIYRFKTDGTAAPELLYSISGVSEVKQIKWFQYPDDAAGTIDALVTLHNDGKLYRRKFNPGGTLTLLGTSVTDFAVHKRTRLGLGTTTYIFATKGTKSPSPTSPAGSLVRYDADSGTGTTLYTASGNNQLLSVATDSDEVLTPLGSSTKKIYITEATVDCSLFCVISDLTIRRNTSPGSTGSWDLIVNTDGGEQLRSDDDYLYFLGESSIKRISTDAPALQLDIQADRVEVVQIIQRPDNSWIMIANREGTFVRGYAHLRTNTTGVGSYAVHARLNVFIDGVQIADSPFQNINNAYVDTISDPVLLRTNRDAGFLFRLPPLPVGSLTLSMTVNPEQSLTETGASPYGNNAVFSPQVDVVPPVGGLWRAPRPTLMMVTMGTPDGIYNQYSQGFNGIMARAKSLLPIEDIIWYPAQHPFEDLFVQDFFFQTPTDEHSDNFALGQVELARVLSSNPPGSYDVHWVGMIHPRTTNFNGIGYCPGSSVVVRMEPQANGLLPFDAPRGGRTLAHELGHNYHRKHVNCGNPADPDPGYPYDPCTIGAYGPDALVGFDSITRTPIDPTTVGDLMSYAADRWTSDYTFLAIFGQAAIHLPFLLNGPALNNPAAATVGPKVDDPVLLIQGFIHAETRAVRFMPFISFPAGSADPERIMESADAATRAGASPNPFRLLLTDATGNVLTDTPIEANKPLENHITELTFTQFVPCPPQTRAARLVQGADRLGERFASPRPPMLSLGDLVFNAISQTLQLEWMASDPDGDPLLFTLQYSPDDGQTWRTLRLNSAMFSAVVPTDTLPGGTMARLRVLASDGFHTSHAISAPFDLPKHDPMPLIHGVLEGEQVPFGDPLTLHGSAMDAEDGSDVTRLRWNLMGPTTLAQDGPDFLTDELSPGDYTAQLTALDRDKQTGTATRQFSIAPLIIPDGSTPVLDGKCDTAYRHATFVKIPLADGTYAGARFLHANGNLYVCFTGLQLPTHLNPTRAVGLRVDVDADGTELAEPGDLGFFINSQGIPYQEAGTGSGMSVTLTPQLGFSAAFTRGLNAWNAEFCLTESVLGGWNHQVRFMIDHDTPHWPPAATDHAPVSWAPAQLRSSIPTPHNRAPIADAGPASTYLAAEPRTIVLDGSASYDLDGDAITYAWTRVSGPAVVLQNARTAHPSFVAAPAPTNQFFTFRLIVSDRARDSSPSDTTVTILPAMIGGRLEKAQCFVVGDDVQLRFPGRPGNTFVLQGTIDFKNWVNLQTNTADYFGAAEFMEHDLGQYPMRFYRAQQP